MNNNIFKRLEPYIAIGIFIMLILLSFQLYKDNQLKKEISINCGFGDDDYFCFCEKSEAMEVKNKYLNSLKFNFTDDVGLDR